MMAPAADIIATKFGLTNSSVIAMLTSIFVLGYGRRSRYVRCLLTDQLCVAFGPTVLGPLSEIFGRARVLQAANLWYLGMCDPFHLGHTALTSS